jgi:hypothetical protein
MLRTTHPSRWRMALVASSFTALLGAAGAGRAQEWVSIDGSPAGRPAEFVVDPSQSSEQRSALVLKIHGFWMEPRLGDDGNTYQKITVPGMGSLNTPGAPDLPAFKTRLGMSTDARVASLEWMDVGDEWESSQILPWPQPLEELEPVEGGMPERFVIDPRYYEGDGDYPPDPIHFPQGPRQIAGLIPAIPIELQPFSWNPATGRLRVLANATWYIDHLGQPMQTTPLTRDRLAMAEAMLPNWEVIGFAWDIMWWFFDADYLIITPEEYLDTLQPFISLKKAQGYKVSLRFTADSGPTCADYRDTIADWMLGLPAQRDRYCLLVGDTSVIPTCTSPALNADYPAGVASDDPYGSPIVSDLDEEVYVGRLSVDSEADLGEQLDRIIDYQTTTSIFSDYHQVGLVAHKEGAPGKYVGAHESVRTASYAFPPAFSTFYGHQAGVDDGDVSAAINAGLGLVCYRGHGSSSAWTGWNTFGDNYNSTDVSALTNGMTPVVWSLACTNSQLSSNDCIGEIWMEQVDHGAVSFYGATVASYTSLNHELDRQLFKAVYDQDLGIHGQAVAYAEEQMAVMCGPENAWMYLQLGDPAMRIKRYEGLDISILNLPEVLPPWPWEINLTFIDNFSGLPISDAVFAIWKPGEGRDAQVDEVFDNSYTDAAGEVTLMVAPQSEGWLYWTLRGPNGETMLDSIPVSDPTGVPGWDEPTAQAFWAEPSVTKTASTLRLARGPAAAATIAIFDVAGRSVRQLELAAGQQQAHWDGRDQQGTPVADGVYFARLREAGEERTARIVMLH